VALEKLTAPKKFTYVPYGGGGAVAPQLVGKHINSSVNNPIEAVSQRKAGALRPLCLFYSQRSVYTAKVTADMAWSDIPDLQGSWRRRAVPDAARHLHVAGRQARAGGLLRRPHRGRRRPELGFMLVIGRENFFKAVAVSVGVPLTLFMMFERWFLVPLPKGPLEAWLGF
jgi:hypothetical protein